MDTIFALASAVGKAGVSIVRVSGLKSFDVGRMLCGSLPRNRMAGVRQLKTKDGEVLDTALVVCFAGKQSFTGEPVVELHLHGSTAVVTAVLHYLSNQEGLRLAEAGEFTRRALENGKLDLAQVEGLADLIEAETEAQRVQANRVLSGELGGIAEGWRVKLVRSAALLEATIDFADEDVPVDVTPEVSDLLGEVLKELQYEVEGVSYAERVRSGFEVAIVGRPNVGKSTLLNTLARRDAAITSDIAGTTRDVIEVKMDIGGLPVTLLDTAGIRNSSDTLERIGIERAKIRASSADLRIFLVSDGEDPDIAIQPQDIVLIAKGDLLDTPQNSISGLSGLGVSELLKGIEEVLMSRVCNIGIATHERHRTAMVLACEGLVQAGDMLQEKSPFLDIAAEEVRGSIRSLDSLVGRVDVENLLDEIFLSFCIGK